MEAEALSSEDDDGSAPLLDCFHCGLPIPAGIDCHAVVDGAARAMCCPGCAAVAELIVASGLADYYRYRQSPGGTPEASAAAVQELLRYDQPALQRGVVSDDGAGGRRVTLALSGLRCAACAWLIERHVQRQPGVVAMHVNLASERAELCWREGDTHLSTLLAEIDRLGYGAQPYRPDLQEASRREEYRAALRRLALAGLGAMQVMMFAVGLYAGAWQDIAPAYRDYLRLVSALVTAPIVAYAARPFFAAAWRDLRNRRVGMDVPVALAIAIAFVASLAATVLRRGEVYFDSVCMFVFLLSLARFLEMRARHRAQAAIEGALRRPPAHATLLVDGRSEVVAAAELQPGDRVLVRPGESVPADGVVASGQGWVNEAMLTGEQWPRARRPGDRVIGGTQNGESPLEVTVERAAVDGVLAGIQRLVDRAGAEKPPVARLADRVARVFVPGVLLLAVVVVAAWWHVDPERALWVTLAVLVVSCPCALSLATPAALTAATGGLLGRGLLITRPHVLEGLHAATHVVFDKTGTLTGGRFRLLRTLPLAGRDAGAALDAARALESRSGHPIAGAFAGDASAAVADAVAVAGLGVEGVVGGERYRIGNPDWVLELAGAAAASPPDAEAMWILLGDARGAVAWFALEDAPRPEAARAVRALRARGLAVQMLSGDPSAAVACLAARLGIEVAVRGASPEDKLRHVRALQAGGAVVLMVGDGVNDAPVLGAAQVSVAMGGGTDLAMSRADAVLLREDLDVLPDALALAHRTRRILHQNLAWAVAYNAIALPLAALGWVTPLWAAVGMSASSLIVVLNAIRLGARRPAASPSPSPVRVVRAVGQPA
ncbi:MAG TPA: heavy metal translocating P-type ATPase [Candidatus Dormibacteraeota bacterium]|nr:heavy metal translocating P-type ATPase [Candidatus Dormibacteraeota bacterium]